MITQLSNDSQSNTLSNMCVGDAAGETVFRFCFANQPDRQRDKMSPTSLVPIASDSPPAAASEPIPTLTCKCNSPRCEVCLQCSRCGCDHDGNSVAVKTKRGRGRPRGPSKRKQQAPVVSQTSAKRPRRETNTYQTGDLAEPPDLPLEPAPAPSRPFRRGFRQAEDLLQAFDLPVDMLDAGGSAEQQTTRMVEAGRAIGLQACMVLSGVGKTRSQSLWSAVAAAEVESSKEPVTTATLRLVGQCYVRAARGSNEKRVLRALLSELAPYRRIEELYKLVPGFTLSRQSFCTGIADFSRLANGEQLGSKPGFIPRQRFSPDAVEEMLTILLVSRHATVYESWGARRVKIDKAVLTLPLIVRKLSVKEIYDNYVSTIGSSKAFGRSSIYRLARALTVRSDDQGGTAERSTSVLPTNQLHRSSSEMARTLVDEPFALVKRILESMEGSEEKRMRQLQELESVQMYLKLGFESQVAAELESTDASRCCLHVFDYGLVSSAEESARSFCPGCTKLLVFFHNVRAIVERNSSANPTQASSAMTVLADCEKKARHFMGHQLRVINQQQAVATIVNKMKEQCVVRANSTEALIVMDFNMSLGPAQVSQTQRGVSWHCAMIQYFKAESDDGGVNRYAVDHRLYVDHLSQSSSGRPDRDEVLSLIEAVLIRLRKDAPHVTSITIQTRAAPCYQNAWTAVALPYLGLAHNVRVTRVLHTETRDGRPLLAAHFAQAMSVLRAWMQKGNNCTTSTQAVIGLTSGAEDGSELPNTIVELVDHDRDHVRYLIDELRPFANELADRIPTYANDLRFELPSDALSLYKHAVKHSSSGYHHCPTFKVTVQANSGVGPEQSVTCAPGLPRDEAVRNADDIDEEGSSENESDDGMWTAPIQLTSRTAGDDEILELDDDDDREDASVTVLETQIDRITANAATGPITGVQIATQAQERSRTARIPDTTESVNTDSSAETTSSKAFVAFAARTVVNMVKEGKITVVGTAPSPLADDSDRDTLGGDFVAGWAIRPSTHELRGRRYLDAFKDEIRDLFLEGERDKSLRRGAKLMLLHLQNGHPDRYDLPSEEDIRRELAKLMKQRPARRPYPRAPQPLVQEETLPEDPQASLSNHVEEVDLVSQPELDVSGSVLVSVPIPADDATETTTALVDAEPTRKRRHRVYDHAVKAFFNDLVAQDPGVQPSSGLLRFRLEFGQGHLTDQQVKQKISNLKTARKRNGLL